MYSNITKKYGCIDCGYFTDCKGNIEKHNQTGRHIEKKKDIVEKVIISCKYQCKNCLKKYKSQSSLWSHNQICKIKGASNTSIKMDVEKEIVEVKEQMTLMTIMMREMNKKQENGCMTTNNTTLFLDENCGDAMNMSEFIEGIEFSSENFTSVHLLQSNALEHTVDIFRVHLNKIPSNVRPIHHFMGEDKNQFIIHYRDNDEWKVQCEIEIMNEINDEKWGKNTFLFFINRFHERRVNYFKSNYDKSNHLLTNLKCTTYPEKQIGLIRKIVQLSLVNEVIL